MLNMLLLAVAVAADLSGTVFLDRNGNGTRDVGEPGIAGVAVSDQVDVVATDRDGAFRIAGSRGFGIVFVSVPAGYRSVGPFWRPAPGPLAFALAPAPPALRVGEAEATGYYELFQAEAARFTVPLWTVPGNHEIFGIERARSNVAAGHPLYGRAMYRHYRGPDYYSFTAGGVHFVGLNSVDIDDQWYYGHVDSVQLAWLARDLAMIPPQTPVVTFNHIPFFTAVETINGYMDGPPAPSAITVRGKTSFRHSVSNAADVIARIAPHSFPLALGGHMHVREQLRYEGVATRFFQTAAVVGPSQGAGLSFPSGITVYRVHGGVIDDGTLVTLGEAGTP